MTIRIDNHPLRQALAEELHARPFQQMMAPGQTLMLAFKLPSGAAERDHDADRAHLIALLDLYGAPAPAPEARQHIADLEGFRLKWECHTEFVTYMLLGQSETGLFAGGLTRHIPQDWIDAAPGKVIAAADVELIAAPTSNPAEVLTPDLLGAFDQESLAVSQILDGNALVLGDFRLDDRGFTRFAAVVTGETGPRRLGRAVQRLLEIEIYRTMAMLALPAARSVARRLTEIERALADLATCVTEQGQGQQTDDVLLSDLSGLAAEIEKLAADTSFRMEAAGAYGDIVSDRIDLLNETPIRGRQQFREFMLRRFEPAMRTILAARERQATLSDRAARLAELLRTRVNVQLEAQNQQVLERMDSRAALQLRLQETVEGLSVVAISYYSVSLVGYLVAPVAKGLGLDKTAMLAVLTIPVVLGVWWFVRRMKARLGH